MDTLGEELLSCSQERSGENDNRGRPVSRLNILSSREVDELCTQYLSAAVAGEDEGRERTIRAAGCITLMCLRMVAPSFVMTTSPDAVVIILSIPRGPRDVRTASATAGKNKVEQGQLDRPRPC